MSNNNLSFANTSASETGDTNTSHNDDNDDNDEGDACPICLQTPADLGRDKPLVHGPCKHALCVPCMERVLSRKARSEYRSFSDGRWFWNGGTDDNNNTNTSHPDIGLIPPTLGRCPICRAVVSLFDLRTVKNDMAFCEKECDVAHSPLAGLVYVMRTEEKEEGGGVGLASFHFPSGIENEEEETTVDGEQQFRHSFYQQKDEGEEEDGIEHLQQKEQDNNDNSDDTKKTENVETKRHLSHTPEGTDSKGRPLPYISFESPKIDTDDDAEHRHYHHRQRQRWKLDDGTRPPKRKYFEEGCHYHAKTRTFHGTIVWSKDGNGPTLDGARTWEIIMEFTLDMRCVSCGVIMKRRDLLFKELQQHRQQQQQQHIQQSSSNSDSNNNHSKTMKNLWPFDGKWRIQWDDDFESDDTDPVVIHVVGGEFVLGDLEYTLDISDPKSPCFQWPQISFDDTTVTTQRVVSGVDLISEPDGPSVGSTVVWTTDNPDYRKITWIRETVGGPPPPRVELLGPTDTFYQRLRTHAELRSTSMPKYHSDSMWGNVFIQANRVGFASYHFIKEDGEGEDGAYISYEHPMCTQWPPLDDGSPVPPRVPFSNTNWDQTNRIFRGTIEWQNGYGTTWQGCVRWKYEMKFDSEFMCIVSGKVHGVYMNTAAESDMSTFGETLVYVNAAILEKFSSLLGRDADQERLRDRDDQQQGNEMDVDGMENVEQAELSPNENDSRQGNEETTESQSRRINYSEFTNVSRSLMRRLESEGASIRTQVLVHHLLVSTQNPHADDPIDFNMD